MRKLHPATIIIALLPRLKEAIRTALPFIVGSLFTGHKANEDWIAVFIGLFTGVFAIGTYWTTRFDIDSNHVVHRTGWIFRKDRRIPLEQIQNVGIRQNLLERVFKVATIDVETAMGHGRDLKLSVLSLLDAEQFREELLGAAHLDPLGISELESPLVRLTNHDLLLGAITENHFAQMILVMFTLGGPSLGFVIPYIVKLSVGTAMWAFCAALAFVTIGGWMWGVISYYLKYGGFTVHKDDNAFRISYGLLSKVQMAIRPNRIEYLLISTTLLQRWMGRSSVSAGTASSFGEAGVLAPYCLYVPTRVANSSASDVIPGIDIESLRWRPFHSVFYLSRVTRSLVYVVLLCALTAWVGVSFGGKALAFASAFTWLVAVINFMRIGSLFLAQPENGFALTDEALVVRQGYFHQTIAAIPIHRIENAGVTQPWWWKSRRVAKLGVQAMKRRVYVGGMPEVDIDEFMTKWMRKIEDQESQQTLAQSFEMTPTIESSVENQLDIFVE